MELLLLPANLAKIPWRFGFASLRPTSSNLSACSSVVSAESSGCTDGALIWTVLGVSAAAVNASVDGVWKRGGWKRYDDLAWRDGVVADELDLVIDGCVEMDWLEGKRM